MKTLVKLFFVATLTVVLYSCGTSKRVEYVYVPQPAVSNNVSYSNTQTPQHQAQSQVAVQTSSSQDCLGMAIGNKYRASASGRSTDKTTAREIAVNRARGILITQISSAASRAIISDAESKGEFGNVNVEDVVVNRAKQTLTGSIPICVNSTKDGAVYEFDVCVEISPSDALKGLVKVLPDDIRLNSSKLKKFEDNFKNEMTNEN